MQPTIQLFPHHGLDQPVFLDQTRSVNCATFIAMVRLLAERFPAHHAILNLCDDRLFFMLGFCAALQRNCTTLLPGNRSAAGLADILPAFPKFLALHDGSPSRPDLPHLRLDQLSLIASDDVKPITLNQHANAATLFTSGSTGAPQPHGKSWGMLATGAALLRSELGISGAVLGSVPPQHMFGLESTVLLPMQAGLTVLGGCPLLPQDIHAAMACYGSSLSEPLWWMTTPLHLRACVQSGLRFPKLAGMLCSTQTLSAELARAAEACFQAPLHEIYGCTEAGMVGLRRPAQETVWRLCPDLEMRQAQEHTWISGERAGGALRLHDHIEMLPGRRFNLHGRHAHLIKVGGKRIHLDALNQALLAVPGVQDGAFFQPTEGERLMAFVVMEEFDRARLLATLRQQLDPAFLPRPLHCVAALPRNDLGKLPLSALLELALLHSE